ncbi:HAD-like protein [Laetiporus sulphureus 93-53]|uniref:HAD-like protein n=1 Tax=Laetiporus sulphureus 93-53 TaxID=1314785 RepID=A0A165BJV1_9APHY|nr:HAD-like protein [Laetiporus sulphureus 93-53]KZT01194.1 HAD-like protein [Laetiporus sulphureus 93-53]
MALETPFAVIFDLGDVLLTWSSQDQPSGQGKFSSKLLHRMLSTSTWSEYECGRLSERDCYNRLGEEHCVDPEDIASALHEARETLRANDELIAFIREMKGQSNQYPHIYLMTNIPAPEYDFLRAANTIDWSLFDEVFTSFSAGYRKPSLSFYQYVIAQTSMDPSCVLFIDDKIDNVVCARSLGFHGIVFESTRVLIKQLRNKCGNPVERGLQYLRSNAKRLYSMTNAGNVVYENFALLLIREATGDSSVASFTTPRRTWNFFNNDNNANFHSVPDDLDTTALAFSVVDSNPAILHAVLDEMLEYVNQDGIIQIYYDYTRPRIDPCACANTLTLFYKNGRGHELPGTLDWVHKVLLHRAYVDGTRYYATPECFLYFVERLLSSSKDAELHGRLATLFKVRVEERIGAAGDPLMLAMRITACAVAGVYDAVDLRTLLTLQCDDGGWEIGWMYTIPSTKEKIGNRGLSTAMALQAISSSLASLRIQSSA